MMCLKRVFDLFVASVLLCFCLPLLGVLCLLIRLDSKGPAFFVHERVGRDGKRFRLWKLRTMQMQVSPYAPAPTCAADPRLTRIGGFLRRTSLDELPQLINVLKGEMSLVGPRPEMPFLVARYTSLQRRRLRVRPGMTGLWQVNGRKDTPLSDNIQYDLYYIRKRSFRLDMTILLRTIPAVLRRRGAY